ncbi:hypothetical protein [Lacibacter sp.]|uniref:hypothetical protein n=1 Tax=Lacibacter sp. TaxID=1915409 RepID=UPI002B4ACF38|nr:hypothetical protein [Lacibacter sp.]HLP37735.1 hypothetical protein [Lacibacter sp.]
MKIDLTSIKTRQRIEPSYFRDYIHFNFEKLKEQKATFAILKNEELKESAEHSSIIEQIYFEDELHLSSYYYHSTIVSLYSWLESILIEICDTIVKQTGFAFTINDFSHKNISGSARMFLSKMTDIEFEYVEKQWHEITIFQKLRNCIVHSNSQIDKDKAQPEILKIIRQYGNVNEQRTPSPFYLNSVDVLNRLLDTAESFIAYIVSQLDQMEFVSFEKANKPVDNDSDMLPF